MKNNPSNCKINGLGILSIFEDDFLVNSFFVLMSFKDLCVLSQVSKSIYVFCYYDDLWKELVLNNFGGNWIYEMNWKQTFINTFHQNQKLTNSDYKIPKYETHKPLHIDNFYSDFLYEEYQSTVCDMKFWESLCSNNIEKCYKLSLEDFNSRYGFPNKPVVIQGVIDSWPASNLWSRENLTKRFCKPEQTWQVGRVDMNLNLYFKYCSVVKEENPLYLFDKNFAEKYPELLNEYTVPPCFENDFFSLLPIKDRPSYRWFFIGPPMSGSTFHKDPNSTSAWNALVKGKKLWIMFPPEIVPPGVYPSKDESQVTTPVSVSNWMLNYFFDSLKNHNNIQCIQKPGDIIYIPNGWWHQVLNLEECIGVTQNFVSECNLNQVVRFLNLKKNKQLWLSFEDSMKKHAPNKIKEALIKYKENSTIEKGGSFWTPKAFSFLPRR